jgi:hypothetical protein
VKKPLDPYEVIAQLDPVAYEVMTRLAEPGQLVTHREAIAVLWAAIKTIELVKRQARDDALRHALKGDWAPMAEYIREGGRLTPQMRPFLADVLDGRIVRPAKKISKAKTAQRNLQLGHLVLEARQRGEKDIPRKAEERFGRTWRQLQKNLASVDKMEVLADQALSSFFGQITSFKSKPPGEEGVTRYLLSDMALTPHTLT